MGKLVIGALIAVGLVMILKKKSPDTSSTPAPASSWTPSSGSSTPATSNNIDLALQNVLNQSGQLIADAAATRARS